MDSPSELPARSFMFRYQGARLQRAVLVAGKFIAMVVDSRLHELL
jgi:hypothetical protein